MPDADVTSLPAELLPIAEQLLSILQTYEHDWWMDRQHVFSVAASEEEIEELAESSLIDEFLSFARKRWPLSHAERLVYAVFSWDIDFQSGFVDRMTPVLMHGRLAGLQFVLARLGYQLPRGFSFRQELREHTDDHLRFVAERMALAQHKWVRQGIDRVKEWWKEDYGSLSGLNRNNIASRLRRLEDKREAWHVPLTSWTEASWAFNQGIRDFVEHNDPECQVLVMPADASDPGRDHPPPCVDFAGQWFSYGAVPSFPIHPDCVHYLEDFRWSRNFEVASRVDLGADELYMLGVLAAIAEGV